MLAKCTASSLFFSMFHVDRPMHIILSSPLAKMCVVGLQYYFECVYEGSLTRQAGKKIINCKKKKKKKNNRLLLF